MQGIVYVQSEEDYERGVKPRGSSIRIGEEELRRLCGCLQDHIEDFPNYHFRLKTFEGQNLYLCLRLGR